MKAEMDRDGGDILCWDEYGIKQGKETYSIPVLRRTLLDLLQSPLFRLIRTGAPVEWRIPNRCAIYIGGRDDLQTVASERMFGFFEQRVAQVHRIFVRDGGHELRGCEAIVAKRIVEWLDSRD